MLMILYHAIGFPTINNYFEIYRAVPVLRLYVVDTVGMYMAILLSPGNACACWLERRLMTKVSFRSHAW